MSDGVLLLPDERYRLEVTASIAATCPAQELIDQIMTADAAEQPQLLEQAKEEFSKRTVGGYFCPVPEDAVPTVVGGQF